MQMRLEGGGRGELRISRIYYSNYYYYYYYGCGEKGAAELMGLLLSTNVDGICCPQCGGGRINSMIRNGRPQWAVSHVRREAEAFE